MAQVAKDLVPVEQVAKIDGRVYFPHFRKVAWKAFLQLKHHHTMDFLFGPFKIDYDEKKEGYTFVCAVRMVSYWGEETKRNVFVDTTGDKPKFHLLKALDEV